MTSGTVALSSAPINNSCHPQTTISSGKSNYTIIVTQQKSEKTITYIISNRGTRVSKGNAENIITDKKKSRSNWAGALKKSIFRFETPETCVRNNFPYDCQRSTLISHLGTKRTAPLFPFSRCLFATTTRDRSQETELPRSFPLSMCTQYNDAGGGSSRHSRHTREKEERATLNTKRPTISGLELLMRNWSRETTFSGLRRYKETRVAWHFPASSPH